MGISEGEFLAMKTRLEKGQRATVPEDAVEHEGELHEKILEYCREQRWNVIHSRMDRKTTNKKGVCDFVIQASKGRTFYIECKSKSGKVKIEQLAFKLQAEMNEHKVYVISAMSEFLEIVVIPTCPNCRLPYHGCNYRDRCTCGD